MFESNKIDLNNLIKNSVSDFRRDNRIITTLLVITKIKEQS